MNQIMKEKNLAVLAIQEAYLDANEVAQINTLFGKRLVIENTQGNNPNAKGVAIILNKEKINTDSIITKEIIPRRAMSITFNWDKNEKLTIMNVYAPNNVRENRDFWNELNQRTSMETNKPTIMLGDMNLVEDAIDRIPSHTNYGQAVETLGNLRESL